MEIPEGLKVISEKFIRPEHEVQAAQPPHFLGPVDLLHLSIGPIQRGHLFKFQDHPTRPTIHLFQDRLKRSISNALVHFYTLAGRLQTAKYEDEHSCLIYVDCTKGPGARLTHATYMDLTVSDILSSIDVHPAVAFFFDLGEKTVNHDGHTKPLLSIQVTELLDGVFIGYTVNHVTSDGTSFKHFVNSLSQIFKSQEGDEDGKMKSSTVISRPPLYKMHIAEGYGPILKLPYLEPEEFVTRFDAGQLRERVFRFGPESMRRLKAQANAKGGSPHDQVISSFIALSVLIWRSITRARNLSGKEETLCVLMMNARPRLDLPLSENYFGNFGGAVTKTCSVEELLNKNLGWTASRVSEEVKKKTHEKIIEELTPFCSQPFVIKPGVGPGGDWEKKNVVLLVGSPRFDMYEPEFGFGPAVAVHTGGSINKFNGKVNAHAGGGGRGSVQLEICLSLEIMNILEADEELMSFVSIN